MSGDQRMPLEDSWSDVLKKALRGQDWSVEEAAARSGLTESAVESLLGGCLNEADAVALAQALGLRVSPLLELARGEYHPGQIRLPDGAAMFSTDWGGMTVHSYLIWDFRSGEAVAFDTGADAGELLGFLRDQNLTLSLLLLTHAHGDHVFEADRIVEKTGAKVLIGEGEGMPGIATFAPGEEFSIGNLTISTRSTPGHSPGGITYVIGGLARPLAIVGDALFAGSMGRPNLSYEACLHGLRGEILSLAPETILCPGHGPLTTVTLERDHNPFFGEG